MSYKSAALDYFEWQQPVIDKDLVDPPGGETKGDRYLIDGVGINAWAGEDGNIATYNGAGWDFTDKKEGMFVYVMDENLLYLYIVAWDVVAAGNVIAGANLTDLAVVRGDGGAKGVKTSTMLISDAGEMTNPSQPAFLAYNSITRSDVTGDATPVDPVIYDTEFFDQGGNFAANVFTAPVDGKYLFIAQVMARDVVGDRCIMRIKTSNKDVTGAYLNPEACDTATNILCVRDSVFLEMEATDTAYVWFYISGGAKVVDIEGSYDTFFSGVLIC